MKANAKKLLALIMAMVMCLSLAAPAMAASGEAVAEATLSVQSGNYVQEVTYNNSNKVFVVKNLDGDTIESIKLTDVTGTTYTGKYVTVTKGEEEVGRVGQKSSTRYRVTAGTLYATDTATAKNWDFDIESDKFIQLSDIAAASWKDLTNTNNWFTDTKSYEVSGSYYAEPQAAVNTYKVYFKLAVYDTDKKNFQAITDTKVVWALAHPTTPVTSADISDFDMQKLLATATVVTFNSTTGAMTDTTVELDEVVPATHPEQFAVKEIEKKVGAETKDYTYSALPASLVGVDNVTSSGVVSFPEGVTTGSFKVDVTYVDNSVPSKPTVKETDPDAVKKALTNNNSKMKFTVSGPDGNGYFTATVTVDASGTEVATNYKGATSAGENTATCTDLGVAVLIDSSKSGTYDGGTKTIPAGYKAAGPVAIAKSQMTAYLTTTDTEKNGWYYYDTVDDLKSALTYRWCGSDGTVEYVQLNVSGDASNKGVTYNATANTVTINDYWASTTGADVTKKTLTLDAADHSYFTVVDTVEPTCKKDGSVTTKVTCKVCNKELSTKTETKAKVQDALTLNKTAGSHYVYTKAVAEANGYKHYIAEYKTETINETKTSKGQVVTTYICNLGEVHDELTETIEVDKKDLQGSGKWDYVDWGSQNAAKVRDYTALFGYTPVVMDTDVEFTTVPVETKKFSWTSVGSSSEAAYKVASPTDITEAIYELDANGKVISKGNAFYAAVLSIKDMKNGEKSCQDGSATIQIDVYKLATASTDISTAEKLADAIKAKKAELIRTHTKPVTIPAEKTHIDANNDGKCDNCSAEINQTTPVNENTTDISKAVVTFKAMTYTGKVAQPTVTVTLDGVELAKGIDYEVEEMQAVNAGTYYLVVKGKGDCTGRVVGTVTIKKAKNTIKVSKSTLTFKVKDLKKKAKSAALKVTKNKGKVSYKSSNKKVTWKSSKVTVAKKTKKGTYKLTFTAKGNSNYKAGSKTVKVVVK